jgi:hypothetical protein
LSPISIAREPETSAELEVPPRPNNSLTPTSYLHSFLMLTRSLGNFYFLLRNKCLARCYLHFLRYNHLRYFFCFPRWSGWQFGDASLVIRLFRQLRTLYFSPLLRRFLLHSPMMMWTSLMLPLAMLLMRPTSSFPSCFLLLLLPFRWRWRSWLGRGAWWRTGRRCWLALLRHSIKVWHSEPHQPDIEHHLRRHLRHHHRVREIRNRWGLIWLRVILECPP